MLISVQIIDRIDLANGAGSIMLYDWMAEEVKDGGNLMRVDADGTILWRALPTETNGQDCFVSFRWDGQNLTANTWSGYRVRVDLQNGHVTVLDFTK